MPITTAATFCATLVDEWVSAGVTEAIIAPGSRSTPLALALAARDDIRLHVFHDERAAAFAALGVGLASRRPALLLCTSGTAATHFHAAVVEADLSGVPLLVCTADRPPELVDVGAPQTIVQGRLFGSSVRWFHDPGVPRDTASTTWRPFAERAVAATVGLHPGPVHLNLPFEEPLVGEPDELPPPRNGHAQSAYTWPSSARLGSGDLHLLARAVDRQRGVIVAGRGAGTPAVVGELSEHTGWPVLADARSSCRGLATAVSTFDSLLRHEGFARDHSPEVVLALGEPPASKVLADWIAASGADVVQVSELPRIVDPRHVVRHRVTASPDDVCAAIAAEVRGASGTPWAARWRRAEALARHAIASVAMRPGPLTEPGVAHRVLEHAVAGSILVVSSSMPVRDVEWFGAPRGDVEVLSNRGANGIDGVVATATGVAIGSGLPVTALLGDVAAVHDSSALVALRDRPISLRLVVVDNDGGGIFSFLPQAAALPQERFELLFGTPHGTDLAALAAAHSIAADVVTTGDELDRLLATDVAPGVRLVVARTPRAGNVAAHRDLHAAVASALDDRSAERS